MYPAGHILGSSQVLIEKNGKRILITGDYKTIADNTAQNFQLVKTDILITEATFGMPVFKHPCALSEANKVIKSIEYENKRNHIIAAYSLGKAQRIINLLRENNYNEPIYVHGSIEMISKYYLNKKIKLGRLIKVDRENAKSLKGQIIISPPATLYDSWSRKFTNLKTCYASGWMSIKQRAKQKLIELPLIISDHADWNELTNYIKISEAENVYVTHGREEAIVHWCKKNNINGLALSLSGREDEEEL
jgi:putative mRNA 3-end processing factor